MGGGGFSERISFGWAGYEEITEYVFFLAGSLRMSWISHHSYNFVTVVRFGTTKIVQLQCTVSRHAMCLIYLDMSVLKYRQ